MDWYGEIVHMVSDNRRTEDWLRADGWNVLMWMINAEDQEKKECK